MKKLALIRLIGIFLITYCQTITVQAQLADLSTHLIVKDSIISKFNRGDFNGIYDMSDSSFRKYEGREKFIEFLKRVNQAGSFLSSQLTEDLGDVKYFRLEMKKIAVELTLRVTKSQRFSILAINRPPDYDTAFVNGVGTDNPLANAFDSSIDRTVRKFFRDKVAAGFSIGIIKDGKTFIYNYGEVKKGEGQLPTSHTYFEIGSITKTFVSTVLAHAVLEKKINLHDDIRKFLMGSFPNLQYKNHPIEIIHLANHTSRLPGLPDDFFKQTPYDSLNPYVNYSKEMFWSALHRVTIDTLPGVRKYYSNYGICVLGYILEQVYGQEIEYLINRYITDKLKMKNSKFSLKQNDLKSMAQGYTKAGSPMPRWDLRSFAASGAIKSTMNDMLKYLRYNIQEKDEVVRLAHRLTWGTDDYGTGLAWLISKTPGGLVKYQHDGGTGGFSSQMLVMPEQKSGFIILSNTNIDLGNLTRELTYRLTKN